MDYLNTRQAAERLGVSPRRILALIASGRLPAEKSARDWLIKPDDLEKMDKYLRGKPKLTPDDISQIRTRFQLGESAQTLAAEFGVSDRTIYRHLK